MKKWIKVDVELPPYNVKVKVKPFDETIKKWGKELLKQPNKRPIPDVIYAIRFKPSISDSYLLKKSMWRIVEGNWKDLYIHKGLIGYWEKEIFEPITNRWEILDI